MALTWQAIESSEFFRWFGVREVSRTRLDGARVAIRLTPGGFQEFIDLSVELDSASTVRQAALTLDRG